MGTGSGVGGDMAHSGTRRTGEGGRKGLGRERMGRAQQAVQKAPAVSPKESNAPEGPCVSLLRFVPLHSGDVTGPAFCKQYGNGLVGSTVPEAPDQVGGCWKVRQEAVEGPRAAMLVSCPGTETGDGGK